jgi:hypothetical protein
MYDIFGMVVDERINSWRKTFELYNLLKLKATVAAADNCKCDRLVESREPSHTFRSVLASRCLVVIAIR